MADDRRVRPTRQGRARLLAAISAPGGPHVVAAGALGEYVQVLGERGQVAAAAEFPEILAHLGTGCAECTADLQALLAMAADLDDDPPAADLPEAGAVRASPPLPRTGEQEMEPSPTAAPHDSGLHVRELPDVRLAEAEAARRQRARWWRERLLVAAAVAVLLMGLSLIGLAYLAGGTREAAPRVVLTPLPATAPGQPAPFAPATAAPPATTAPPTSSGPVSPSGMSCPPSHPIKGNRESMIYHLPGGGFYEQTRPEFCFAMPADAEAAGFRRSRR